MVFEPTINLGHIITLLSLLITFITWGQNIKWSLVNVEKRLADLEDERTERNKLIIANSIMADKLEHMTKRLDRLESKRRIDQ